jgi:hypothetical protein
VQEGLFELASATTSIAVPILSSPVRPAKRAYDEIADSEEEEPPSDDDYGWDQEDELAAGLMESEEIFSQQPKVGLSQPNNNKNPKAPKS